MTTPLVHILIAFLVLFGLIFLNLAGGLGPFFDWGRLAANFLSAPIREALLAVRGIGQTVIDLSDLVSQNQILARQVEELTAQLAVLEKTSFENRALREALGFETETRLDLIAAEVIGLDPSNLDPRIILNRGQRQGLAAADAVVVPGGILVGIISEVLEQTSTMQLLTSSGIVINGQTASGGATGLVRGEHGLGLLFDLVSQTDLIKTGDRVVTSGLGGNFPKNLLIGEIGEIESSPSGLFQKASLIPAANLRNLRLVFVIKK